MHKLEEMLINSTWRFSRGDGQLIAPVLQLLPRGVIGGYAHANERRWAIRNGLVRFLNSYGVTTTVFDHVDYEGPLPRRMAGQVRFAPTIRHVIERIAMPSVASAGEETQASKAEFLARIDRPKRQNLVVLRANAQSLHKQWTNDVSEEDRNWDLCISWYDTAIVGDLGPHEYLTHQAADRKFTAIYALFYPGSPLWNYEYIWLPDDDLLTSKRDINRLFEICYRYDLLLAQPSVTAQSFASHPVTRQDDRFWLRFSMFVEIMCPIFSNQALRTCLESMKGSLSGFGLDYVWPRLLGDVVNRIAIIDEVAIFHTRPTGKNYNVEAAYEEGGKLMRSFGAATTNYAVGGVTRNGVIL